MKKHHLLIQTLDIVRATEFYETLFGRDPVMLGDGMVWFDLEDPALYLTIRQSTPQDPFVPRNGVVWLETTDFIPKAWGRLNADALVVDAEDEVGCYFPSSNRLWVRDPDGNRWNLFVRESLQLPAPSPETRLVVCFDGTGYRFPEDADRGVDAASAKPGEAP